MTVPVATKLSNWSSLVPEEFQPWMEMVADVKPERPSSWFEIVVITESFEYEPEKS